MMRLPSVFLLHITKMPCCLRLCQYIYHIANLAERQRTLDTYPNHTSESYCFNSITSIGTSICILFFYRKKKITSIWFTFTILIIQLVSLRHMILFISKGAINTEDKIDPLNMINSAHK